MLSPRQYLYYWTDFGQIPYNLAKLRSHHYQDVQEELQGDANKCMLRVIGGSPVACHSVHQVTQNADPAFLQYAPHPSYLHRAVPILECPCAKLVLNAQLCVIATKKKRMRTVQEICIMDLEESREVLLLYVIINIIAHFLKGREKNDISVILILPYCCIILFSDHLQLEWNYYVMNYKNKDVKSCFLLMSRKKSHCNWFPS